MKPTMLATVNDWPVITSTATAPMAAIGKRGQHLQNSDERVKKRVERQQHAGKRDQAQQADGSRGRLLALELPAVLDEIPGGAATFWIGASFCWISATTPPKSRPAVLHWTMMRRRTFSWLIVFRPARFDHVGHGAQRNLAAARQFDAHSLQFFDIVAEGSSSRTSRSNVCWPSTISDTTQPLTAVSTSSLTSAEFRP